ncbi:hypothetical protein ACPV5T_00960 [Vibrio astriarenae]
MKRLFCLFVVMNVLSVSLVFSKEMPISNDERQYLNQLDELVVAKPGSRLALTWLDSRTADGSYFNIAMQVGDLLAKPVRIVSYESTQQLMEALQSGEAAFSIGFAQTPARQGSFYFSTPIYNIQNVLWYYDNTKKDIPPEKLTWGCVSDTLFCELIVEHGATRIIKVADFHELYLLQSSGQVDAAMIDFASLQTYYALASSGEWLGEYVIMPSETSFPVQLMSGKNHPTMTALLEKAAQHVDSTEVKNFRFNKDQFHRALVIRKLDQQYGRNHIRYTIEDDIYPLSYRDPKTGAVEGYIHDIIQLIERKSGISFTYVEPNGQDVKVMLKNKVVDALPAFSVDRVLGGSELLTLPFATIDWAHIRTKKMYQVERLGVLDRSRRIISEYALKELGINAFLFQDIEALLDAVSSGAITDAYIPQSVLDQYIYSGFGHLFSVVDEVSDLPLSRHIGIKLNQESVFLRDFLNTTFRLINRNEVQMMVAKHHRTLVPEVFTRDKVIIFMLITLSVIMLVLLLTQRSRGLRAVYKTPILIHQNEQLPITSADWWISLPNMIMVRDAQHRLVFANSAFSEMHNRCKNMSCSTRSVQCDFYSLCHDVETTEHRGVWLEYKWQCKSNSYHYRVRHEQVQHLIDTSVFLVTVLEDVQR